MIHFILSFVVLAAGALILSVVYESLAGNRSFSLPLANITLVVLIGGTLFPFWGWTSTIVVLGLYSAWCVIGGLMDRACKRRRLYDATLIAPEYPDIRESPDLAADAGSVERVPWSCARCGHRVPRYVDQCRCGQQRPRPAPRPEAEESISPPLTLREKFARIVGIVICLPVVFFILLGYFFAGPYLDVVATAPSTVVTGQTFTLSIKVSNPGDTALELLNIKVERGSAFEFTAASPRLGRPSTEKEEWGYFGWALIWSHKQVLEPGSSAIYEFAVKTVYPGKRVLEFEVCTTDWGPVYWNWGDWGWRTLNCPRFSQVIEIMAH